MDGRRFALDVDGNTNAWANLFQRLLLGCCVIKVASPFGYRQWYYDDLVPWVHYVPVRADMADLVDRRLVPLPPGRMRGDRGRRGGPRPDHDFRARGGARHC